MSQSNDPHTSSRPIVDVAILGAGIAGLTAAYRLVQAGKSVLVLEGRDRVGGRTLEGRLLGQPFDLGGQWVGPDQTRIMALLKELELKTFPQYLQGLSLLELQGKITRYRGVIPRLSIFTLLALDRTIKRINRLAGLVDPVRPWDAPYARQLDLVSVESWLRSHVSSEKARAMVRILVRAVLSAEASEVSMQFFLTYIRSAGSLETLTDVEGAAQQDRIAGGAFQIARRLADRVGVERIRLNSPARRVEQSAEGVRVITPAGAIEARYAVLAMSPNLTLNIDFAPERPVLYDALARRMPMGSVTKALIAYETPFWRAKGLAGLAASDRGPFGPVFDAGLPDDPRGYIVGFLEGDEGRRFALRDEAGRRAAILKNLSEWFGPEAADAIGYIEKDWSVDPWSGGCYTGFMTPGTMTTFGAQLREPFGRIHRAGTESAVRWQGYFDGAVESGERVCAEILARYA